jgi:uncharacterized membrane protein
MSETRATSFASIRNAFLTGLLLLAPLVVTVWALRFIIGLVGGSVTPLFAPYLPSPLNHLPNFMWDLIATIIALALVTLLGYLSRYVFGRFFGGMAQRFIQGIPGIGGFYNTVKQFIETFGSNERSQFSKVVLVQFPRAGAYTIGFLTNTTQGEPHQRIGTEHWAVFVPTCPSPTNGYFIYLPASEIIVLDMSVGEGMKVVISCGAVLPVWKDPSSARAALAAGI